MIRDALCLSDCEVVSLIYPPRSSRGFPGSGLADDVLLSRLPDLRLFFKSISCHLASRVCNRYTAASAEPVVATMASLCCLALIRRAATAVSPICRQKAQTSHVSKGSDHVL